MNAIISIEDSGKRPALNHDSSSPSKQHEISVPRAKLHRTVLLSVVEAFFRFLLCKYTIAGNESR